MIWPLSTRQEIAIFIVFKAMDLTRNVQFSCWNYNNFMQ